MMRIATSRAILNAPESVIRMKMIPLAEALGGCRYQPTRQDLKSGKKFADELRTLVIKYRNIGHDWKLTDNSFFAMLYLCREAIKFYLAL